jgi:hypothetical protein
VTENESPHSGSGWEPVPENGAPFPAASPADGTAPVPLVDGTAPVPPAQEGRSGSGRRAVLTGEGGAGQDGTGQRPDLDDGDGHHGFPPGSDGGQLPDDRSGSADSGTTDDSAGDV